MTSELTQALKLQTYVAIVSLSIKRFKKYDHNGPKRSYIKRHKVFLLVLEALEFKFVYVLNSLFFGYKCKFVCNFLLYFYFCDMDLIPAGTKQAHNVIRR